MEKTVYIEGLAAGGDGVTKQSGKVCFVPYAAKGDTLRIRITQNKPKFTRGIIVQVLEPGPGRRESTCPLFGRCGGCTWLHLTEQAQAEAKQDILARALGTPPDVALAPWVSSRRSLGYRRLARLHYDPSTGALGFMETKKNRVVDIQSCPVLADELTQSLSHLRETLKGVTSPVEVRLALGQNGPFAVFRSESPLSADFYSRAKQLGKVGFSGAVVEIDGLAATVHGSSRLETTGFDTAPFVEPAASFGQANQGVNRELLSTVSSWVTEGNHKSILELFAGSGNLTVAIAPAAAHTMIVESDPDACAAARHNIDQRRIGKVTVVAGDALEVYQNTKKPFDLIVLDPPRTGHRELAKEIANGTADAILYVSCNAATLARDIEELKKGGFRLIKARGFDMFPQTPHIEVATLLVR